jgi:branched-chain amino acid transport system ATP-binding protein
MTAAGQGPLLQATGLLGGYGGMDILQGVDLAVDAGEVVVVVGPNGAGKSTAMKALIGLIPLKAGKVVYDGSDITGEAPERLVGRGIAYVPQERNVFRTMSVEDNLAMGAYIRRDDLGPTFAKVYALFPALKDKRRQRVGELSGGQRQMVAIARALMIEPKLLLLDEPTVGLDIVSKEALRSFLAAERAEAGTTILLTTHDLPDIERLSDRVVVVDGGRVVHTGTLAGLAAEVGVDRVLTVELTAPAGPLGDVPGTRLLSVEAGGLRQHLALTGSAAAAVAAVSARTELRDLTIAEPDIEDVVARLYRRAAAARSSTVDKPS